MINDFFWIGMQFGFGFYCAISLTDLVTELVTSLFKKKLTKKMKEHYVTYEQAVKLKELGFDEPCYNFWALEPDGKPLIITSMLGVVRSSDLKERDVAAPFLWQAQAWLRDCKDMDVLVFNCACGYGWEISKSNPESRGTTIALFDDAGEDSDSGMWLSYESALSAGIDAALDLLTNKD